jgi:hypothetical protein
MQQRVDEILADIEASSKKVPVDIAERRGPFVLFNGNGTKAPLFWCFNNWAEAAFLSRRLGPEQPLVAMHSFHNIVKDAQTKLASVRLVAMTYAELMQPWMDGRPVVIGGNCQAAPIAEAIAHRLTYSAQEQALLIVLEHNPFYGYPGNILMLFGEQSEQFNPFVRGEDPVPGWNKLHHRPSWGFINAGHGKYFVEPGVDTLTNFITRASEDFRSTGRIPTGATDIMV